MNRLVMHYHLKIFKPLQVKVTDLYYKQHTQNECGVGVQKEEEKRKRWNQIMLSILFPPKENQG